MYFPFNGGCGGGCGRGGFIGLVAALLVGGAIVVMALLYN